VKESNEQPWMVAAAALGLVVAAWGSLELAPTNRGNSETEQPMASLVLPSELSGFDPVLWFLPDDGLLGFVEIVGGSFTMGSDPETDSLAFDAERWSGDRAQGLVELPTFYMSRYEVTVAQFTAFVRATGYRVGDSRALQSGPNHPVARVSWTDALAYTRWLDTTLMASQSTPALVSDRFGEGWHIELPTEAQWEKAARGTDGRIYPWGDKAQSEYANYRARETTPVGSFPCAACANNLEDMSGNVWEWTRSPYQAYPYDPSDDLDDLEGDALWVMRGGSFGDPEQHIRAANRGGADPGVRRPFIGFRLVLTR
jgi:formylglycine-generating enzyme required for sulfatase activity